MVEVVPEEALQGRIDVKELVKLIKSDLKDVKKKEKIKGIVLYSVQEAFKSDQYAEMLSSGANKMYTLLKSEGFRNLVMRLIEG